MIILGRIVVSTYAMDVLGEFNLHFLYCHVDLSKYRFLLVAHSHTIDLGISNGKHLINQVCSRLTVFLIAPVVDHPFLMCLTLAKAQLTCRAHKIN